MGRKIWKSHETNTDDKRKRKFGYARVSTEKQSVDRQINDIHAACPDATIYYETYTGTTSNRPEWAKLLHMCKLGLVDEIWFCDVSRMSRNKEEGYETWKMLHEMGIDLYFITTPQVNTTTYEEALSKTLTMTNSCGDAAADTLIESIFASLNEYMISLVQKQIYIAFEEAEQEAKDLSQRTKEGIEVARIKGKQIGRAQGVTVDTWKRRKSIRKIKKYYVKYGGQVSAEDCMKICEISKSTFYRYIDQIDSELNGKSLQFTYRSKLNVKCK